MGDEVGLGEVQQRPHEPQVAALRDRRHGRQPRDAAAPQQAEKNGLGLIIRMMAGQQNLGADLFSQIA